MLDVRVNLLKNRLYLTLYRMHGSKLDKSIPAIENAVKKLSPGFTCIIRFVDIHKSDPTDFSNFEKLDLLLSEYGMACVVRVGMTGHEPIPPLAADFTTLTANTIEAAERQLNVFEATVNAAEASRLSG